MITLTVAASGIDLASLPGDCVLHSPDEYLEGYRRIVENIYAGKDFRVVITNHLLARWLKILAQRYGPDRVTFREITIRSLLEDRIGIAIPPEIKDADILESGLLDLNIPASGQASFGDYLLDVFLGSFLTREDSLYRVNEILAAYEPEQWQSALKRPLVRRFYQEWLHRQRADLKSKPDRSADLPLLSWLEASPETYIRNLSALKLLSGYQSSLGERIFGPTYKDLLALNLDIRRVPVILHGNEAVLDEILLRLHQVEKTAPASLDDLLNEVSGYLEIELETVILLLRSGSVQVTYPVIQRMQRKFEPLRAQPHLAQALSDLYLLVAVDPPTQPKDEWDVKEWLRWAADEYLPYRFWSENTGRLDEQIGNLAGAYADWLYKNYGSLRYNSEHMAWKAFLGLRDRLKALSGPALVVMVDNFNVKFYPLLQRLLQQQGFYEQNFQYCLSMLPSFTQVSKKCIITGHYAPFKEGSYNASVEKTWAGKLGKKVRYLANINELRQISNRTHDVYFLNYLPIDYTLHQEDCHTGISHIQTVQVYLDVLARDIRAFARRLGAERDLLVVFLSDHGSTRIPRGEVNVINNKLYQKHALDEHHRYITISDEEADKLSDQVKYECYLFRRTEFDLPENYLVARRLYRFQPTDDSIYIHGGLTPEETIIPFAVYQPITVAPRALTVRVLEPKKIIAGTRQEFVFEITNHNSYPVEQLVFEIIDVNLEADPVEIEMLQKLQRCQVKFRGRCPSNADILAKHIQVQLTFQFIGQRHEQTAKVEANFDTLVKTRFNLDEF